MLSLLQRKRKLLETRQKAFVVRLGAGFNLLFSSLFILILSMAGVTTKNELHEVENEVDGDEQLDGEAENDKSANIDDPELEAIKARVKEMEEEAEKLKQLQTEVDKQMNLGSPTASSYNLSLEEKMEVDNRSIYVGNVDYGANAEELEQHFHGCGSINRVTILCNKFDGHPKGFAYIEFADKDSVQTAMALDESLFRGRQIKVNPKRTNKPGMSTTSRPPYSGRYRGRISRGMPVYGYRLPRRPRSYVRRPSYYMPY